MSFLTKRATYQGMDCVNDMNTHEYMMAQMASQKSVPYSFQPQYAKYTVYFGVVIIFVAFVKNYWYILSDKRYMKKAEGSSSGPSVIDSIVAIITSYSRYVGYKPLNRWLCNVLALPSSVGSLLFVITTGLYLACYCLIPHFWYRGCRGFGSPPLAVRAGIMTTALTPFIYVLSGKSNLITLLTGISYEKLNFFHQFTGFMALVLSMIHVIPFIWQDYHEGGSARVAMKFHRFVYYSGIPPFVCLFVLCVGMNSRLRKLFYEGLLHLHWMLGIAFFATLWWHINSMLSMQNYLYGALAFWATQILYRILVKTCFRPCNFFMKPRPATLTKISDNTFEILVTNAAGFKWGPGQHCFLRFTGSRILDNHPFSICSLPTEEGSNLKFIIVPQKGLTKILYDELCNNVSIEKKVFLDGPYGGTPREPFAFDNVSLYSSGSGVTVTIPYLTYLSREISKAKESGKPFITKDIHFVWIAKYEEHYNWIREEIDQALELAGEYITIDVYFAKSGGSIEESIKSTGSSSDIEKGTPTFASDVLFPKRANVHYQKPNFRHIVVKNKNHIKRKSMFVSSGSASMRRDVASGVSELQSMIFNADINKRSHPIEEIYLHSEAFGW